MAMSKKEKEIFEQALTNAALRHTHSVPAALNATREMPFVSGFHVVFSIHGLCYNVKPACSTMQDHSTSSAINTSSQKPLTLHASRVEALQELRFKMEQAFAEKLREMDIKIAQQAELDAAQE